MKSILALGIAVLGAFSEAQVTPAPSTGQAAPAAQQSAPAADSAVSANDLKPLEAMTFGCPRAGLNAAAREAAKERSQGTYQFSFFKIVSESHHAAYEVHFSSNYAGEADLKYCVVVYCQQGWDPKTAKMTVTKMTSAPQAKKADAHESMCGVVTPQPPRRKTTR
jgi:hypothetical protein